MNSIQFDSIYTISERANHRTHLFRCICVCVGCRNSCWYFIYFLPTVVRSISVYLSYSFSSPRFARTEFNSVIVYIRISQQNLNRCDSSSKGYHLMTWWWIYTDIYKPCYVACIDIGRVSYIAGCLIHFHILSKCLTVPRLSVSKSDEDKQP